MSRFVSLAAVTAVVLSTASMTAVADDPFKKPIQARQGMMQVYSFNLGILAAMAKGNRDYDAKAATTAANNLNLAAMMDNAAMWPQGSDLTNKDLTVKTTAKKEAWTTWPKIGEKQDIFKKAAATMADAAGGGLDSLRGAIGDVGKSCKGCHDDFRAKKK